MLEIFDNLAPFFEDCYRRISVREYARIRNISPPTASDYLREMHKLSLLTEQKERVYIFYSANRESEEFIDLSRLYWKHALNKSGLANYLVSNLYDPALILFGSMSKAEVNQKSDIDIAAFSRLMLKSEDFSEFEKKLHRKLHFFHFKSVKDIKNMNLQNSILNGFRITGEIEWSGTSAAKRRQNGKLIQISL